MMLGVLNETAVLVQEGAPLHCCWTAEHLRHSKPSTKTSFFSWKPQEKDE